MGSPMQGHTWHGPGGVMAPLYLPIPMAIFGVVVSFMFGATLGMKWASKRSMMGGMPMGGHMPMGPMGMGSKSWMHGGMCGPKPGMMMGGMMGDKGGMPGPWMAAMAHHHHGNGAPGCCEQHEHGAGDAEGGREGE
jgi:hypothetical protein